MIAVDTNVLVNAHRLRAPFHAAGAAALRELAEGGAMWAIPWPCVHEFIGVVTRASLWPDPTPVARAVAQVRAWVGSPTARLIGEHDHHLDTLADLLDRGQITGAKVHDARVAAICLDHGVRELLTADRDFSRFPQLRTRNPLIA